MVPYSNVQSSRNLTRSRSHSVRHRRRLSPVLDRLDERTLLTGVGGDLAFAAATPIELGIPVTGTISAGTSVLFRIGLDMGGRLVAQAQAEPGDTRLCLHDSAGRPVLRSE